MSGSYPDLLNSQHNKYRLALSGLLLLGTLLFSTQPLYAESRWQDIPDDFWAKSAINSLNEQGILLGGTDRFYPYRPITRAEYASILAKALPPKTIIAPPQNFSDVPKNHWAASDIQTVVGQGWLSGVTPRQFKPNQILTMAELYASLGKIQPAKLEVDQAEVILSPYQDQNQLPEWARVPVAQAVASGLTLSERSKTRLSPNLPATRASVAVCVHKSLRTTAQPQTASDTTDEVFQSHSKTPQDSPGLPHRPVLIESVPAANVVGQLAPGETPDSWQVIRADGKRFRLNTQALETHDWQAGQTVQVTGNLDAVRGTANDPILVLQTAHLIEPFTRIQNTPSAGDGPAPTASNPVTQAQSTQALTTLAEPDLNETTIASPSPAVSEETLASPSPASRKMISKASRTPSAPAELKLYFPNLANLVSDPSLMLGEAIARPELSGINPRQAVEAILGGPTDSEKRAGYFMDADLKRLRLDKFSLNESGLATVQLYAPGDFQFSNSSVPARLDEQIRRTLKQFEGIDQVKISVKNPKDKTLWISP